MRYMIHVVTLTAGESAEINGMGVNGSSTVCVKCAEMVGAFGMLMSLVRYQMRGVAEVYQGARKGNDNLPGPSQKSNVTPRAWKVRKVLKHALKLVVVPILIYSQLEDI